MHTLQSESSLNRSNQLAHKGNVASLTFLKLKQRRSVEKKGDKGLSLYLNYCWRRRYFKFNLKESSLEYYVNPTDQVPKGIMSLSQGWEILPPEDHQKDGGLIFQLVLPNRVVWLCAETPQDYLNWCSALSTNKVTK